VVAESEIKVGDLSFSLLNTLLVVDRYPPRLGKKTGLDTPLLLRVACPLIDPRASEAFLVTSARGRFVLVPNRNRPEQNTACIPCKPSEEDDLLIRLVPFVCDASSERGWGNYAVIPDFGTHSLDAAMSFLSEYELPTMSIFLGVQAYKKIRKNLTPPEGMSQPPYLKDLLYKSDVLGSYRNISVFLLPRELGDYVMVNGPPPCVGSMTRIGDHIALLMHNLIRGFAIYKVS